MGTVFISAKEWIIKTSLQKTGIIDCPFKRVSFSPYGKKEMTEP